MYQVLGNTGIELYSLLNYLAIVFVYIYHLANFKNKMSILSNLSQYYIDVKPKNKISAILKNKKFLTLIEIVIITNLQFISGNIFSGLVGNLFGTGTNYFGKLLLSPILLQIFYIITSTNPFKQTDLITPALPFALVISKLACFCHGCCRGIECSFGLYNHSTEQVEFPTQLLETSLALVIGFVLIAIRKKIKEGTLFPIYLILFSATRFFSEFTRAEEDIFFIFKTYHFICLLGVIVGVLQLVIINKYREKILKIHDESCFVIIDFIHIVLTGFGFKKEKRTAKHKKNKGFAQENQYRQLSNVKFDFSKIRMWILVWLLGVFGQTGWNIESTWFNTFVYEKIDKNPAILTLMLIAGALATTLSIWILGTITDRTGNRRKFISCGFIIWGVLLMSFGLTQFIAKNFFSFAIICLIIGDMLISFFASMSTDVGYSIWLTDIMNDSNKGQIGAAIAVQCVLGALFGNIIGGFIIGSDNNYLKMFFMIGSFIIVFGILSARLFSKKDDVRPSVQGSFSKQLFSVVNFKNLLKQKELLWVNISVAVFFIGFDTYYPHLGNYLLHYLGYSADKIGLIEAVPLVLAMIVTVPASKYINNDKFSEVTLTSIISGLVGVAIIYFVTPESINTNKTFDIRVWLGVFLVGVSYVVMLQATKVWTKKLYPTANKGQYEVLWALSYLFIPTVIGSNISNILIKNTGLSVYNEVIQRYEYIPKGNIFMFGALISTISIIPILITKRYNKKKEHEFIEK